MKSSSFFPFMVFLALGILASCKLEEFKDGPIKIGHCPYRKSANCFSHKISECDSDWQCPGTKKCCQDRCDIKCTDPLSRSSPVLVKPGKCSMCRGLCMMLNPPNLCSRDGQCEGNYKCCRGVRGKICLPPQ